MTQKRTSISPNHALNSHTEWKMCIRTV